MITKETKSLSGYSGGDRLGYNSSYIYIDNGHFMVERFDLEKNIIDKKIDLSKILNVKSINIGIQGIAANDSIVYVREVVQGKLLVFNSDLNLKRIVELPDFGDISLELFKNELYTILFPNFLVKVNPDTGKALYFVMAPCNSMDDINIVNDSLYFVDYNRKCIGVTPLNDIYKD